MVTEYRALFRNNWKNTENKQKLKIVMAARSSSQCSGSSAGASAAGGNCQPYSSNDFESFDSESEISRSREVVSLLNRLKSSSPADMHGN